MEGAQAGVSFLLNTFLFKIFYFRDDRELTGNEGEKEEDDR